VIVEVLSPSSEARDRGDKFEHYRSVPSLQETCSSLRTMFESSTFCVSRPGSGCLRNTPILNGRVLFPSLDVSVAVSEIYAQVELPLERPPFGGLGNSE
jgi:Uma2 family endonuclease